MNRGKEPLALGSLRFLTGPSNGNTYPITKTITSIGRDPANDIVVSDPSVSRHHAQIIWDNGSWLIKKSTSQNTLTVNQHELPESPLNNRDTVGLGPGTTFLFLVEHQIPQQPNTPHPNLAPTTPGGDTQLVMAPSPYTPPATLCNREGSTTRFTTKGPHPACS